MQCDAEEILIPQAEEDITAIDWFKKNDLVLVAIDEAGKIGAVEIPKAENTGKAEKIPPKTNKELSQVFVIIQMRRRDPTCMKKFIFPFSKESVCYIYC